MTLSDIYSAMLTVKFDFAIDNSTGKFSTPQETYKLSTKRLKGGTEDDYNYKVVDTRVRVRGTGKVVVMRYESSPGKDFQLIGRITPFTFETEG
jgi:hypothetical protein